jgi:hypothetical protein
MNSQFYGEQNLGIHSVATSEKMKAAYAHKSNSIT